MKRGTSKLGIAGSARVMRSNSIYIDLKSLDKAAQINRT